MMCIGLPLQATGGNVLEAIMAMLYLLFIIVILYDILKGVVKR